MVVIKRYPNGAVLREPPLTDEEERELYSRLRPKTILRGAPPPAAPTKKTAKKPPSNTRKEGR